MANNFGSIGFRVNSQEDMMRMVANAAKDSKPVPTYIGGAYLHYSTPEKSELWIQVSPDREFIGCNPHFAGISRLGVTIDRIITGDCTPLDGRLLGR